MKERLDIILVERGIASSRERARALIMEGKVLIDNRPAAKAGEMVNADAAIDLKGGDIPYVSRGGLKIEAAFDHFAINLTGMIAMDAGSSTGGFTDCMLKRGVQRVYCIDVGYGQLAWPLRNDPRIVLLERTNIRYLEKEKVPDPIDIATIDLSFISLTRVLATVTEFLKKGGLVLALVKPQFEVGKGEVGKGGIVRDEEKRVIAVNSVRDFAETLGLETVGVFESPVPGQKGNREYFLLAKKS